MTKALLDEGLYGCPLLVGQLAGLGKETIWYLYGRLHMASHITRYGQTPMIAKRSSKCPGNVCRTLLGKVIVMLTAVGEFFAFLKTLGTI
jgi:hypothetical protein